ncbi:GNAT family N-acetyltransferase [Desulfolucanica intricata]|uniref:GNAT family N-acetyltransferase n=1 Tax=Desulfolucanica intricata TaxID=1285191 RepID=UPI0008358C73|nr:GNAT family N-acetyltransferase [Desulfolucanica intricata]
MKLEVYKDKFYSQWNDFVKHSRNGTFMQERTFLNYHPPGRFTDCSLMVYDSRDKIMAVIPAALKKEGEKTIFSSYPGASHGGIIVDKNFGTNEALTLIPLLIEHCRAHSFKGIEIKQIPRIYYSWPSDELDFALRYNGFFISSTELATALPLKEISIKPEYMHESARRNIRKAEKQGVTVEESSKFSDYWKLLVTNLKQKHNTHPTHTLQEIFDLAQKYPQSIKLFAAFYKGEMIAGVLTFILNSRVINCFYICHNYDYQHLRPLNLLFYRLINWGIEKSYQYLDWGISTEDKGKYVNQGLFRFKESFGGRGVLRETYRLNL